MLAAQFQDAVESSAKVFGRKSVRVLFAGSEARTNGDLVVLPALPSMAEVSEEHAQQIRGYRDHEAAHVRCTDMRTLERLGKAKDKSPLLADLMNYFEDARIEHAIVQEYPGCKDGLAAMEVACADRLWSQVEARAAATGSSVESVVASVNPDTLFTCVCHAIARQELGMDAGAYEDVAQIVQASNPALYQLGEKYGREMAKLPTGYDEETGELNSDVSKRHTKDALDLAEKAFADYKELMALQERQPPPPPPQPQPQPQQQEQGGGGDGEGKGGEGTGDKPDDCAGEDGDSNDADGKGKSDGGQGGEPQGGEQPSDNKGDEGSEGGNDTGAGEANNNEQASVGGDAGGVGTHGHKQQPQFNPNLAAKEDVVNQMAQDLAGEARAALGGGSMARPWKRRYNGLFRVALDGVGGQYLRIGQQFAASIKDRAAMIRRLLELQLQARSDRDWQNGHRSGRLSSSRLVDAVRGHEGVYMRRQDGKDMDTILRIFIDGSGSMSGSYIEAATKLSLAMCEALERTGCEIDVETWDDNISHIYNHSVHSPHSEAEMRTLGLRFIKMPAVDPFSGALKDTSDTNCTTSGGVVTYLVKGRNERVRDERVLAKFGYMPSLVGGGTPMVDATTYALTDILKEKHGKRILMVLTDGDSNGDPACNLLQMKELHKLADKNDIHLIGVGIDHDVSAHFRDHVLVNGTNMYEVVIKRIAKYLADEHKKAWHA